MIDALLAFDEGPGVGLGHRRRCEFVAEALRRRGLQTALEPVGGQHVASVIVVDSYRTRADDRDRYCGEFVVAIEDLGRDLAVDLLVVPAPGATTERHRAACRTRAGAPYVVVHPDLAQHPTRAIGEAGARVLVTTGGTDSAGAGYRIAEELVRRCGDTAEVRLVIGPWGRVDAPAGAVAVAGASSLADELAAADVVVTAGGITMLESLCLGRPTVVVVTADNQRPQVSGVLDAHAAWEASVDTAARRARTLLADESARQQLSTAARGLIDGCGAERIAHDVLVLTGRRTETAA